MTSFKYIAQLGIVSLTACVYFDSVLTLMDLIASSQVATTNTHKTIFPTSYIEGAGGIWHIAHYLCRRYNNTQTH